MGIERMLAGRYRLLDELGRGGMGVVWRARDELVGRDVAVKAVRAPESLALAEVQLLYDRLEREGRATARPTHRNIVTVHDILMADERPWIVMELVRGRSFARMLEADGPVTPRQGAAIGAEVAAALRAAHTVQILHRDVKPGNILIANSGRVVLTDFGIALVHGVSAPTPVGELMGSPEYMAPERALGHEPGPASDLWSLGMTLYTAVEGHTPFHRHTPLATLRAVVEDTVPPPLRAGPLTPVLEGLLRHQPRQRLTSRQAEQMLRVAAAGGVPERAVPPPATLTAVRRGWTTMSGSAAAAVSAGRRPSTPSTATRRRFRASWTAARAVAATLRRRRSVEPW